MTLTRVEDLGSHPALVPGDECFHLHEVPAQEVARLLFGQPADFHLAEQARNVIATMTPEEEKALRMRFGIGKTRQRIRQIDGSGLRRLTLRVVAHALAEGLASAPDVFGDLSTWTLVPIPPASTSGDDEAGGADETEPALEALASLKGMKRLDPVARLLNELAGQVPDTLDVRASIRQARALSSREPTVEELKAAYEVDTEPPASGGVLLFGDVLGDGARFRACKEVLQAAFPGVRVVGVFVAKVRA